MISGTRPELMNARSSARCRILPPRSEPESQWSRGSTRRNNGVWPQRRQRRPPGSRRANPPQRGQTKPFRPRPHRPRHWLVAQASAPSTAQRCPRTHAGCVRGSPVSGPARRGADPDTASPWRCAAAWRRFSPPGLTRAERGATHKGVLVSNGPIDKSFDAVERSRSRWLGANKEQFARTRSFCVIALHCLLTWTELCRSNPDAPRRFWTVLHSTNGVLDYPK